jgi:hypothetical protein
MVVQIWVFDQEDGSARLLRQRSGHSAPPSKIRYYGADGHTILTAAPVKGCCVCVCVLVCVCVCMCLCVFLKERIVSLV